jgi:hypothetical protein
LGLAKGKDKYGNDLSTDVTIYEYVDKKTWAQVGPDGAISAPHNLGRVPGVYRSTFSPNRVGKSQFKEQISLMVAVSRIITQKIAYLDRVIYPITWVKGLTGELTLGPNAVATLSEHGSIGQLAPPATLQVDRDLSTLERYQRILNRNPEVRQGEVDGKGAYVGAKTLDSLNDSVDNSVARFWDAIQSGYEELAAVALEMDEGLYAFLENVQAWQAELKPIRMAIESMPGGNDANRIMRELELDKMDKIAFEGFLAQAQQGQLDMGLWSKYRKMMEDKGLSWYEAFTKMSEDIQKQADAAAQQPVPETGLTTPSPQGAPPEEALQGVPPSALLGG